MKLKEILREWLGVTDLERRVGKANKSESLFSWSWVGFTQKDDSNTLYDKHEKLRDDFEELDRKFDLLERYLSVELIKTKTERQTYDWADHKIIEEYRKTKPYKQVKKEKESPDSNEGDDW